MKVNTTCLQPILGPHHVGQVSFSAFCSEMGVAEAKRWFSASTSGGAAGQWRETHLLGFLRAATDLSDPHILSVFDLLDPDGRGVVGFAEFHYLILLLVAIEEGRMKLFLYQRSAQTLALLQTLSRNNLDASRDERAPPKVAFSHLCMLLRPFGLEELLPGRLAELRLAMRREIPVSEAQILLFAISSEFDRQKGGPDADAGLAEAGVGEVEGLTALIGGESGDVGDEDTMMDEGTAGKTKVCTVS